MAGPTITHFDPDPARLAALRACIDNYDVGDPDAEWPNNMLSRRTVVYASGVIARSSDRIKHDVDPDELDLCRRLASEVAALMDGIEVGMGSESGATFHEFYIVANLDDPVPGEIDERLIREKFGGTIFPPATIAVEPLKEEGVWWSEILLDAGDEEGGQREAYLRPWRDMIAWFGRQPEFISSAFLRIGDRQELWEWEDSRHRRDMAGSGGSEDQDLAGTSLSPCVLPRLALGLTRNGSLVGLFGYIVQT
jgi:hypothetical protein